MSVGLLEKESTGGAIARVGFEYQDAYVLQSIPKWLSQTAFSHVVSEAVGDIEVCYFGPAGAIRRVMCEAKNHTLTATAFWDEVERFKLAYETSPLEFVRFVLVCRGYNSRTSPFIAKVERLRGVGSSYQTDSTITATDRLGVLDWATKSGYRADLADFALSHVEFVTYASESADSSFTGELERQMPAIDLSGKQAARLRDRCKKHIARSSFGSVYRKDLEASICEVLEVNSGQWSATPTRVLLLGGEVPLQELGLNVGSFNGPARATLSAEDWQALAVEADGVGNFVKASSLRRCIALNGKQRMSTACMLGHAYSATRGFTLEVEHNGTAYRTDIHARAEGSFFRETSTLAAGQGDEGVACIGFPTPVGADLATVSSGMLAALPQMTLDSTRTLDGVADLNLAVAEAKTALMNFRSSNRLSKLHLFIKAPSVFAMVLGHRLNGVCAIQLYDWVGGQYVPTALLAD